MVDIQRPARTTARQLVAAARAGDFGAVSKYLDLLTEPDRSRRQQFGEVLTTLIQATASMMRGRAGDVGPNTAIVLDLSYTNGAEADIDELTPPVRAVVRALLAEVNDHPDDATYQIALAMAGDRCGTMDGLVLALMWTISAITWCEDNGAPAPGWLAATAA